MNTRFVAGHLLQYTLAYAGCTVAVGFLAIGPGGVILAMLLGVLLLFATLAGSGGAAQAQAGEPAGLGSALAAGEGDHASPYEAVKLGGAGRLYYAVGLLLLGGAVVATQL